MKLQELRERRAKALTRAREINDRALEAKRELTAGERREYDSHMADFHALGDQVKRAEELDRQERAMAQIATVQVDQNVGANHGDTWRRRSSGGGNWRDDSGQELRCLSRGDRLTAPGQEGRLGRLISGLASGKMDTETRASIIGQDAAGGYNVTPAILGEVVDLARDASVLASAGVRTVFAPQGASEGRVLRQAGSDPTISYVPEGALIPEGDVTFDVVTFRLRAAATVIKLSRQWTRTSNGVPIIEQAVARAVGSELDRVALLGTGAAEEPLGVSNADGVNAITSVGDVNYDDILNAMKKVREANFEPTGGIWSPATDYELSVLKDTGTGQYLVPPAAFTGLPRFITNKATDALAFVGDWTQMFWVQSQDDGMRIDLGQSDDSFKRDVMWLRVVMPIDVVIVRPAAFCKLSGLS